MILLWSQFLEVGTEKGICLVNLTQKTIPGVEDKERSMIGRREEGGKERGRSRDYGEISQNPKIKWKKFYF